MLVLRTLCIVNPTPWSILGEPKPACCCLCLLHLLSQHFKEKDGLSGQKGKMKGLVSKRWDQPLSLGTITC